MKASLHSRTSHTEGRRLL